MDQREFNRQMGSYLRERKSEGGGFLSKLSRKLPNVTVVDEDKEAPKPNEVPREHVEAVMRGERVPAEEVEFEEDEIPKRGFMAWVRDMFEDERAPQPVQDVELAELERRPAKANIDDDVKEMLRICVRWVNRLPPEEIQEIRRTDEYQEFKRLLDKYGLLKK